MRTGPCACLPGEIRTPSAAFGGLRPIHLARRPVVPGARGRIRTCGRTINRRLRFQLRHPGKDVPVRATPWGITGPTHAVRVPPGSRTLLAGLEDRVLAARTAVRKKRRRRESNARDCRRPMNGVPTRGLEPPEPAFVALAAIQLPWAWRSCVTLGGLEPAVSWVRTRSPAVSGQRREKETRRERRNRTSGAHHHHPGFRDRLTTNRQRSRQMKSG